MSIWKDLLFLGGYIATPTALRAVAPPPAPPAPRPAPPAPAPAPRLPWAGLKADHLLLR